MTPNFTPAFQEQVSTATLACHSNGDNKSVNTEYIKSKNLKEEKAKHGAGRDKSSRLLKEEVPVAFSVRDSSVQSCSLSWCGLSL